MKPLLSYLSLNTLYPKTLGLISASLGLHILYRLVFEAAPMANLTHLSNRLIDQPDLANNTAVLGSFLLAGLALVMGYRGLVHNNVCIGGHCSVDSTNDR